MEPARLAAKIDPAKVEDFEHCVRALIHPEELANLKIEVAGRVVNVNSLHYAIDMVYGKSDLHYGYTDTVIAMWRTLYPDLEFNKPHNTEISDEFFWEVQRLEVEVVNDKARLMVRYAPCSNKGGKYGDQTIDLTGGWADVTLGQRVKLMYFSSGFMSGCHAALGGQRF